MAYEAIRTLDRDGTHSATILAVHARCRTYLDAPIPGKSMAAEVERRVRWFDEWAGGKEFRVRVASTRIDRGSIWHHWWWNPDPRVRAIVKVGAKSDRTQDASIPLGRDVRDLPGDRLGPFRGRWDDTEVSVPLHHEGASAEDQTASFDDQDSFKVRHLDGLITFDGGKIAVRLECPEVAPPALPSFWRD